MSEQNHRVAFVEDPQKSESEFTDSRPTLTGRACASSAVGVQLEQADGVFSCPNAGPPPHKAHCRAAPSAMVPSTLEIAAGPLGSRL